MSVTGIKLLTVQVSHHPPVGAAHAENKEWEYDMVSAPTTKFLGNSIDIYPIGWPLAMSPAPSFPSCHLGCHKLCYVMSATLACALSFPSFCLLATLSFAATTASHCAQARHAALFALDFSAACSCCVEQHQTVPFPAT